jgi:hypothetical protein
MITVHVRDERTGNPVKNARVLVSYYNPLPGHDKGHTNGNGDFNADVKPGRGSITVNGREVFDGQLSGRMTVYV